MTLPKIFIQFGITILIVLIASCNSDKVDNEDMNDEPENSETTKNLVFMSDGDDFVNIIYENMSIKSYMDDGSTYSFEYDEGGKLSSAKNQHGEKLTYERSNNRLQRILKGFINNDFDYIEAFNYNDSGQIISIIENSNDGYDESNYFEYDNGVIKTHKIGADGNVYSFEFDNAINPFYIIWEEYGLFLDLEDDVYDIVPMFAKHNPIKIFKNNELQLEIIYEYDEDNYPISAQYISQNSSGTIEYRYGN